MNIIFYKTKDPVEVLNKTLTDAAQKVGNLIDPCGVLNPVITFNFNPVNYNYAFIAAFNRYYYADKPTVVNGGIWQVSFHVDPLMSWKNDIKKSPCIAAKSSTAYNLYLNDPNYKCYQDDIILMRKFTGGFSAETPSYVLALFGDKEVQA